jgi:ATP-dependent DNA helicase RecQ
VLALTATASPIIREEIMRRLHQRDPLVVVQGFDRPNIWLGVERYHDERTKREALLERVAEAAGPGIVYVATHKHAEELAGALQAQGKRADFYHAGMRADDRNRVQEAFMGDELEVIVATNAFGLGVDKPNVRYVFHYDVSDSVDSYYQEIGRAGRDGEPARAILFYRSQDLGLHRFFAGGGKVDVEQIERVAEDLDEREGPVAPAELREETGLSAAKLTTALTSLEEVGAVETLATGEVVERHNIDLHGAAEEAEEAERRHRLFLQSRIDMMRGYAEVYDCRREYLLNYFGQEYDDPCNYCDNDEAGISVPEDEGAEPFPINSRVTHAVWGEGMVQRYEGDTMVVVFDEVGYKTLAVDVVRETGALKPAE